MTSRSGCRRRLRTAGGSVALLAPFEDPLGDDPDLAAVRAYRPTVEAVMWNTVGVARLTCPAGDTKILDGWDLRILSQGTPTCVIDWGTALICGTHQARCTSSLDPLR